MHVVDALRDAADGETAARASVAPVIHDRPRTRAIAVAAPKARVAWFEGSDQSPGGGHSPAIAQTMHGLAGAKRTFPPSLSR